MGFGSGIGFGIHLCDSFEIEEDRGKLTRELVCVRGARYSVVFVCT